jgi:hypothetical protein
MTKWDKEVVMSRLTGVTNDAPNANLHLGRTNLVIEAVFEDRQSPNPQPSTLNPQPYTPQTLDQSRYRGCFPDQGCDASNA